MEKVLLAFLFTLIYHSSIGQISNVSRNNRHIYVYNAQGRLISDFFCLGDFFDYSEHIIASNDAKHIYIYDQKGLKVSDFFCFGQPTSVAGENIITKDGKHVYVYDKYGRKLSDFFER